MLESVLIANRGEIAVRLIRACRALGIRAVAVYSEADAESMHVRLADAAYPLGPSPATQSYLNVEKILGVCREAGVQAVHPGYGFLSENADFSDAVTAAGMIFIGPSAKTIAKMGDKLSARSAAMACEVPVLPASQGPVDSVRSAEEELLDIGFPLIIKASFGGGGRGMRLVRERGSLEMSLAQSVRESQAAFGRSAVYLERYIPHARHVEVQILADHHGTVLHLGDRDCSVQRRHQKLLEEAPAPGIGEELRLRLQESAVRIARSVDYRGAGTVEYLVDPVSDSFYFLEMNTRLQVEHGITEMVTGIDLVEWQLKIAAGQPIDFTQSQVAIRGHAIQARISAEDCSQDFTPSPGRLGQLKLPTGPWLRLDFGVESGDAVPGFYDALFGKIQAWGMDRDAARRRLVSAIGNFEAQGIVSTAPYLCGVLQHADFVESRHHTESVENDWGPDTIQLASTGGGTRVTAQKCSAVGISERLVTLSTLRGSLDIAVFGKRQPSPGVEATPGERGLMGRRYADRVAEPVAPMDSTVIKVHVSAGDPVCRGDTLLVLEAMKMELEVRSPSDSVIGEIFVAAGDTVSRGSPLLALERQPPG